MPYIHGVPTFLAGEDLAARRRVKIESGTTNDPPEVVYADAGESAIGVTEYSVSDGEYVAIRPLNMEGSQEVECVISSAIARGAALYAADDGKITDEQSGAIICVAVEAAAADNDHIEVIFLSENGLNQIVTHVVSAQNFIPVPLTNLMETDASNTVDFLGPATTPVLDLANGDTDSSLAVTWAASNSDPIVFQTPLPPNLDVSADVVVHLLASMGGATDTPTIASDAYFNVGDTKVEDASAAITGTTVTEYTITIAAADVPAGAQTLSVELTPGAHTTDTVIIHAIWIEYTGTVLTS